jgi:16S rRNA (uracil1498-N3)-methyltransferase
VAEAAPSFVHLPDLAAGGDEIVLSGDEAHYVSRVVRARAGERLHATDGAGLTATLEVLAAGAETRVRVLARERHERAARLEIWCGVPEGDRADWLVEKLGELGVAALVPVDCARASWGRSVRHERWERLAIAAMRQSRSPWKLELAAARPLGDSLPALAPGGLRRLADPLGGAPDPDAWTSADGGTVVAVGPSSGFDASELKRLSEYGFTPVRLAQARLRTETAALAVGSLWAAACRPGPTRA